MSELISAVGGVVGTVLLLLIVRPKALMTILVAIVAPFPGSRLYQRYRDILALVHGTQPDSNTEEKPALTKTKNSRRTR